jgi:hypothetical protein
VISHDGHFFECPQASAHMTWPSDIWLPAHQTSPDPATPGGRFLLYPLAPVGIIGPVVAMIRLVLLPLLLCVLNAEGITVAASGCADCDHHPLILPAAVTPAFLSADISAAVSASYAAAADADAAAVAGPLGDEGTLAERNVALPGEAAGTRSHRPAAGEVPITVLRPVPGLQAWLFRRLLAPLLLLL